jgi:hypothetical protein
MIQIEGLFRRPESGREIEWEPNLLQPKTNDSMDQTKNSHEQATNWTNTGPCGPFVPTRRTVRQVGKEQLEPENAKETTHNPLWISQTTTWIEERFWGDV